ncbi:conserved membrane protein of unknown function [Nitrospira japonica]|uniref:Major facilitator superfamily (MFS) profile domain-containing protein n=1 Tax=Nitrospira japonica TaxID=1325564 RepID=A0A1W1I218_9BACT|nr:MFS transporter [Nitrospira japonica]SLM46863.1 conserved membrane protein of unknown function [Nitrospira japonica]
MPTEKIRPPSRQSLRALDALNVLLADVRDGVGPYLAIYLLTAQQWDPASVGVAMSAMGISSVLAQTPCGMLIDALKQKRLLIALAALFVGAGCAALTRVSTFDFVIAVQALNGVAAAIFPPAVAAITLGLVGPKRFAVRTGRNEAFNHAGNVGAAALAGAAGHFLGLQWIFFLVSGIAVASVISVWFIREEDIDHDLARGAVPHVSPEQGDGQAGLFSGFRALLHNRILLIFALSTTLFHFANAAMLPLAGQLLSRHDEAGAPLYMTACIIAAQIVMIPVAAAAGILAERWGRKPVLCIGFAALPIRGFLYTLSDDSWFIVVVQLLDGIGAGVLGVLWVTVVADLTQGSGNYNLALGAIATAQGIGAAFSHLTAGYVVNGWGYQTGFVVLAVIAGFALALLLRAMPETGWSHEMEDTRLAEA